MNIAVAACLE